MPKMAQMPVVRAWVLVAGMVSPLGNKKFLSTVAFTPDTLTALLVRCQGKHQKSSTWYITLRVD